ncbi:hypothetical protein MPF_0218 [Methanohalophilus portucalensis FDF-1]|uniref:Uncharacterized protein n=1 Tax=Methanohalophilus portucalensis FDF-1 TaxID=523843 RepID=A0A1L9C784_9EURY|nr:hypothetical protein MPF_0218 [Methanohalophilus portucalensis FDF-1]
MIVVSGCAGTSDSSSSMEGLEEDTSPENVSSGDVK